MTKFKILSKIKSGAEKLGGAILGTKSTISGKVADIKRGHALYRQGYGGKYDSALKIAKAGKKEGRQRPADRSPKLGTIIYNKSK